MAAPTQRLPGQLGERFLDPQVLGTGSFAVVLRVHDRKRGEIVALKLESPSADLAPELYQNLRARFQREAQVASRILHENVVRTHEFGVAENRAFLVCEYLECIDLRQDFQRRKQAYSLDEAMDLGGKILLGLEAAHKVGVQHRDLKPANILLGTRGQVKIADFGLARHPDSMELTLTGVRAGTPLYTAPEVFLGEDPTLTSDVYSYGVLFLQILTGRCPFPQVNFMDMLRAKANWAGPEWGPQLRTIPASIRALVEACLETKPVDRPRTAIEARVAFEKARDSYLVTTSELVLEQLGLPARKKARTAQRTQVVTSAEEITRANRERQLLAVLLMTSVVMLILLFLKAF